MATHSATKDDADSYFTNVNEVCQSNQHFDNMHKLLLLSCGVDISTSTAKENNVDGATNVNAAICLDIVKAFYHLNHIYKSINLK